MRRTLKSSSSPQTTKTTSTFAATTCAFVSRHGSLARRTRVRRSSTAWIVARPSSGRCGDRHPVADGGMLAVEAQAAASALLAELPVGSM